MLIMGGEGGSEGASFFIYYIDIVIWEMGKGVEEGLSWIMKIGFGEHMIHWVYNVFFFGDKLKQQWYSKLDF